MVLFGLALGGCGDPVTRELTETPASSAGAGGWVVLATVLALLVGGATGAVVVWRRGAGEAAWPVSAAACSGLAATAFALLAGLLFGAYQLMLSAADPGARPPRSFVAITHVSTSRDTLPTAVRNDAVILLLLSATPAMGAVTCGLASLKLASRRRWALPGTVVAMIATFMTLVLSIPLATLGVFLNSFSERALGVRVVPFESIFAMLTMIGVLSLVAALVLDESSQWPGRPPNRRADAGADG